MRIVKEINFMRKISDSMVNNQEKVFRRKHATMHLLLTIIFQLVLFVGSLYPQVKESFNVKTVILSVKRANISHRLQAARHADKHSWEGQLLWNNCCLTCQRLKSNTYKLIKDAMDLESVGTFDFVPYLCITANKTGQVLSLTCKGHVTLVHK